MSKESYNIPKFELSSCPILDIKTKKFLDTRLSDDHLFESDPDGPFSNSVICSKCGQKGYTKAVVKYDEKLGSSICVEEYHTERPKLIKKCEK